MSSLVDALRHEHESFSAAVDELRRLADDCRDERPGAVLIELDAAIAFLVDELVPHARVEEAVLYPTITELTGSPVATDVMIRDHVEIRALVTALRRHRDELGSGVQPVAVREVAATLYALHAIVALHLAKEDEHFLPLLAELPHDHEAAVLDALRRAAPDGLAADGG